MACNSGPKVDNADLITNMDLGNTKSFSHSTSASSWYGRGRYNYYSRYLGSLFNTPTFHSRGIRSFFSFGGFNHYASVPHASSFNRTAVTISCWVNFNTTSKEMVLISKRTSATAGSYHLYVTSSGVLTFSTFSGGSESTITNTPGFQVNTWYHIVASASSTSRRLYVNGSQVVGASGVTIQNSTSAVTIGRDSYTSARYFNGRVTKVKIYGRQLSDISIAREYRAFRKRHQSVGTIDPSYSVTPADSSVDEGSSVTFNVNTSDVSDGTTLYYTLSGGTGFSSSDLAVPSAITGTCVITNNSTSVSMTLDNDATTEGNETCKLTLYTDSARTNQVAQSSDVTINDTSTAAAAAGQIVFTATGTTTWTVPSGVSQVSSVCVGAGGGAGGTGDCTSATNGWAGGGGGGGGLAYGTFAVTAGETLTVIVGSGGAGGNPGGGRYSSTCIGSGSGGGSSQIKRSSTVLLQGGGGGGGSRGSSTGGTGQNNTGGSGGTSSGTERDGGGTGGVGGRASRNLAGGAGGGAAGYSGNGGRGKDGNNNTLQTGTANGSGGGGSGGTSNSSNCGGGGGVGLLGEGSSGTVPTSTGQGGNGGSGGSDGSVGNSASDGGNYGGGGGADDDDPSTTGGDGGQGAVRIMWGDNRSYPSTNVADQ